jgi:hypothetical protein
MNLIYLYDEMMRVPSPLEGKAIYIIDPDIQEGYEISQNVQLYRYQLAQQAGADIYQGKTLDILNQIHQQQPHFLDNHEIHFSSRLSDSFSTNQAKLCIGTFTGLLFINRKLSATR